MTLTGSTVSGVPTTLGTTSTTLTATSSTTAKTGTSTFTWSVIVGGDINRKNTSLLLTGTTPGTPNFVTNYANNNSLTPAGNTRPNNFSPYTPGYYSNFFDGSSTLTVPAGTAFNLAALDFSIEMWVYPISQSLYGGFLTFDTNGDYPLHLSWGSASSANIGFGIGTASAWIVSPTNAFGTTIPNKWTHLLITRSGNNWRTFQDGVLRSYTNAAGTVGDSSGLIYLGSNGNTGYYSSGNISNLRIIKGSVPTSYQTSSTTLGTTVFTPSTDPFTTSSQGAVATDVSLLTCQSNRLIDNSQNNFTITRTNGTVSVKSFHPFTPNANYSTYGSAWFFTNGGAANSDYISGYTSPALGTQDHTIEFWYYNDGALQTNGSPWTYNGPATQQATNNYYISIGAGGSGVVLGGGGTWAVNMAFTTPPINAWSHIAVTRSGSTFRIFVNGVQAATATSAQTITAPNGQMLLGTYAVGAANGNWINGYVSDFRYTIGTALYTANFTPPTQPLAVVTGTQVLTLQTNQALNNNAFIDNSGNTLAITRNGNATQGSFSPYGANWSNYFDGTGDYLNTPSSSITSIIGTNGLTTASVFTIEAWIYQTQRQTLSTPGLIGDMTATTGTHYWGFGPDINGLLAFYWYDGSSKNATGNTTIPLNTWTHIAVVINATNIKLFVNGILQTLTGTTAATNPTGTVGYLVVGQWNNGGANYGYYGYVNNLRITKSALYTTTFTPSTEPLTATASTGLLTCCNNQFIDNSSNAHVITKTGDTSTQTFSPFSALTQTPTSYSNLFNQAGVGGYLTVADNPNLRIGTNPFTVECWVYLTSLAVAPRLIQKRTYNGTGGGSWALDVLTNGSVTFSELATPTTLITTAAGALTLNTWYHVALTRDSSNVLRLFINGVSAGTTSPTSTFNFNDATNAIFIGANNDAVNDKTQGSMSNVRLVIGSAVYTSNFTPSTTPLTAVSGTQLLTCQSNIVKDNSANNFAITQVGTSSFQVRTFNPFGFTTSAKQEYSPTVFGGSGYFDGSGDFLSFIGGNPLNLGASTATPFTVEAWVYPTVAKDTTVIGNTGSVWRLALTPTRLVSWVFNTSSVQNSTDTINLNQWNHIAFVYNGSTNRMFVNGVIQATTGALIPPSNTAGTIYIGRNIDSAAWDFPGYITDVHVVRGQALYTTNFLPPQTPVKPTTNSQLLLNMNDIGITDYTRSVDLETVGDTKIAPESALNGLYYSNYFNGSSDYLTVPSSTTLNLSSGDFTIEAWVYWSGVNASAEIIDKDGVSGSSYPSYAIAIGSSKLAFTVGSGNGTGYIQTITPASTTFPTNTWTHVAAVKSGTTLTIYQGGINVISATQTGTIIDGAKAVYIGYQNGQAAASYWGGNISNVRIVKGTALYTANFTPSTTPLTAVTNTQLLTCQSNKFVDSSTNAAVVTRAGTTLVKSFNPFQRNTNTSMYFDGVGDSGNIQNNPALDLSNGNFTIEMWVYNPGNADVSWIDKDGGYAVSFSQYTLGLSGGKLYAYGGQGGQSTTAGVAYTSTGTTFVPGQWNHVAYTRSGTTLRLFLNGNLELTATQTGAMANAAREFKIAVLYTQTPTYYNFYMEDLRVTKGVARYTANFTPPTAKLQTK
jgi:hypothetical protein